jgi:hypothetical protein
MHIAAFHRVIASVLTAFSELSVGMHPRKIQLQISDGELEIQWIVIDIGNTIRVSATPGRACSMVWVDTVSS